MPSGGFWDEKAVAITGGTGSFGRAFSKLLLEKTGVRTIRIVSRDELKQSEMARDFPDKRLRFLIGDVRSEARLERAFDGVDFVVHAAAMKRIQSCEYNPDEAVMTNIDGARNVIAAARAVGVGRVLALSSDKATDPQTTYGGTKFVAERLFVRADEDPKPTRFAVVRYGNVTASRGSLVPLLLRQRESGQVTLTDKRCTRFWMSLGEATVFVKDRLEQMGGGELFVPKLPSYWVTDMVEAVAPGCVVQVIGPRGDEKLHEMMISLPESRRAEVEDSYFVLHADGNGEAEFTYTSDRNENFLSVSEIQERLPRAIAEASV